MTRLKDSPRRSGLPALGIGLLVVLGALAGATAYTGSQTVQTQEDLASTLKAQVNASGYARVTSSTYQRGFLSSTQVLNVMLGKEGEAGSVPIIITNRIQHGPLPGFKTVGNALIDTEVKFADAALQKKVEEALGGQQPVIRTVVGLDGSTNTHFEVPKGQFSDQGAAITWQPLTGDVSNGLSASSRIDWPEFKVTSPEGNLTFSGLSGSGTTRKQNADDLLGVGDQTMTLKSLTYSSTSGEAKGNFTLSDLKAGGKSTLDGGFYNAALLYDIGQLALEMPGSSAQNYKNVQLHLSMNHLSREPLSRLAKTFSELGKQSQANPNQTPDVSDAQQKAMLDDAVALLKSQPVLSVDRVSLTQPSGEIVLTGKAELPGAAELSSENVEMLSASPLAALGLAKLQAQFKAPEAALRELLTNLAPEAVQNLDGMIQAGMLKREGTLLVSDMAFESGAGTVNGQALGGGF
ncbi:DUF945 domain-containing protein [Deinococcus detaillensis]|uniref:DUF945 domain-containing protein n=1 Tax=Deinococcus detaillensis TaxID=2592048 RepID=A0A553UUK6_9DEIO|nr:YdgA family protein [Deinococcus detaillensis]TSA83873.1 DUF945 domain-containing protein [Deinococcus detaillensis]